VIVGRSPAIRRAVALAECYARTRLPILLVGATGTGKELFAEHIHQRSGRPGPLVDVNCGALPRDMVESLLFGHCRGAFTGAVESSVGHIERSDGGTLFLDELTSLSPEAQGTLLRVLEKGEVQPLGAGAKRRVDFRVVSAVQDDISAALASGCFRRDLFQRVAGVAIELSPLAERPEDIPMLAEHFAALQRQRLEPDAERVLLTYSWPGNVRELRLVIERAAGLVRNGTLHAGALAEAIRLGAPAGLVSTPWGAHASTRPEISTRGALLALLREHEWIVERVAAALGIGRTALFKRLRAAGISLRDERKYTKFTAYANAVNLANGAPTL